jgi:hypothetical protein
MTINSDLATTHDEYQRAILGMRHPEVVLLPAGSALFRFASTRNVKSGASIPSHEWARGPWWFLEADYRKVIERYQAGALGLGTVARAAAAVQPSWSAMDVSIKARLRFDTNVYLGKGKTQHRDPLPNGMFVTLSGWPDIDQVYIPNLRGAAFAALEIVRQKVVTTDGFGF